MTRRQAEALAGVAPHPNESGHARGYRKMHGGRAALRAAAGSMTANSQKPSTNTSSRDARGRTRDSTAWIRHDLVQPEGGRQMRLNEPPGGACASADVVREAQQVGQLALSAERLGRQRSASALVAVQVQNGHVTDCRTALDRTSGLRAGRQGFHRQARSAGRRQTVPQHRICPVARASNRRKPCGAERPRQWLNRSVRSAAIVKPPKSSRVELSQQHKGLSTRPRITPSDDEG